MGMGGEAKLIRLSSRFEAEKIWQTVKNKSYFILSGGSNLLVGDDISEQFCVKVEIDGAEVVQNGKSLSAKVGAGVDFDQFVEKISSYGLTGFEVLSGIPGLIGASPVQNIGAYGAEVADFICSVFVYDTQNEEYLELDARECGFGYRSSIFNSKAKGRYWILEVNFNFTLLDDLSISHRDIITEIGGEKCDNSEVLRSSIMSIRHRKGMLSGEDYPKSAGSFFKNPVVGNDHYEHLVERFGEIPHYPSDDGVKIPAAWLIGMAGYPKGCTFKGVGVSPYHNLSLINRGHGNFDELIEFSNEIIRAVDDNFKIILQIEPEMVS